MQMIMQQESSFFSELPVEIRLQIYTDLLLDGSRFDLMHPKPSIYIFPPTCEEARRLKQRVRESREDSEDFFHNYMPDEGEKQRLRLAMLYTCKQAYDEAIGMVYSIYNFKFPLPTAMLGFLRQVSAQNLALISSIELFWPLSKTSFPTHNNTAQELYDKVWNSLSAFTGLRRIHIVMRPDYRAPAYGIHAPPWDANTCPSGVNTLDEKENWVLSPKAKDQWLMPIHRCAEQNSRLENVEVEWSFFWDTRLNLRKEEDRFPKIKFSWYYDANDAAELFGHPPFFFAS